MPIETKREPMIRIYSWNVNGIRAVLKKGFLEFVNEHSPDILCLQETKAHPNQLPDELLNHNDYFIYYSSAEKKGYSGVSLWARKKPKLVEEHFDSSKFNGEGRMIKAHFNDFVLYNIYFPNGTSGEERLQFKMDFYDNFLTELTKVEALPVIVCGDVNTAHKPIDLKNAKANEKNSGFLPMERDWIDRLIEKGYTDTFRLLNPDEVKYSWWSYRMGARKRNVGWRIDYFFANAHILPKVKHAQILDQIMGSDHCPITLSLELEPWI